MEEIVKRGKLENLGKNGLLRYSVGNPRCGVDLRQGVGYLAVERPRCQNGTPQVRHDVAVLCHGEGLHGGEGLHRGVAIVHRWQNFGFLFRKSSFCTPIV